MQIGWAPDGSPAADCYLRAQGTGSSGPLDTLTTPLGIQYPVIDWDVQLTDAAGEMVCDQHPLGGGNGVGVRFTTQTEPETFGGEFPPGGGRRRCQAVLLGSNPNSPARLR